MANRLSPSHAIQKPKARFLSLALAFVLAILLALQATPAAADGWVIQCADCPKLFSDMTDRSLRLDASGHPHIAYGEDHLYYAWHDGANWHYETVDDSPSVGQHASLALDGGGYPHISYCDRSNLKYAYQDASGWHIETVDSEGRVGHYTSLALDENGHPHISYRDSTHSDLKYAYQGASGWHIETVDSEEWGGYGISLALDEGGYPHISYCEGYPNPNRNLKYAYQDASGWHIETVDSEGWVGKNTSLALDENGYPHISYYALYGGNLKYAYRDASGWHIETVDSEGSVYDTSLALDGDGYPHISYRGNGDLKYVYQDTIGWHIETADSEGTVGWYTSLALDEGGCPHISYLASYPDCDLRYSYQDASGWHIQTVDSEGYVSGYNSLALDGDAYPHISYYYCGTSDWPCHVNDLKYAYQDASGWHIQTVDSEGYLSGNTSLALDGDAYPHISYYHCGIAYPRCRVNDLKYAYQDASGWHIQTVDSEGTVGQYTSLALDEDGYPHISYYYCGTAYPYCDVSDLKYAYQDASGWHVETVDSEGNVGEYTSLALDGDGYPHMSYYDDTNERLKYAYMDASGWHVETVDSEGNVGEYTSLALDGDGYPHMSYYDDTNKHLKYAYLDASGWHAETVDNSGDVGRYTSLALDGGGYPHISYFDDYPNNDLKYAYQDASGWHFETIDRKGGVGYTSSLALNGGGYPHMSYYDGTNGDLKYAYYSAPWLNWRDPSHPLLLPLGGTRVNVEYGNIPVPAALTATLTGPAVFADDSQVLTATITSANGSYPLHLKPAAVAERGDVFTLGVTLADLQLERVGTIAWGVYLPLILKETL